jgi:hypothetical protein
LQARLGDVDDHGATPSTAGQIVLGQDTTGRLEVPRDVDWYKVSLKANVAYSFRVDGKPEGLSSYLSGPDVALVDAFGRALVGGMHDQTASLFTFQPVADGDYYVTVSTSSEVFSYTISSVVNADDRYLGSAATTGTLSPGGVIRSAIDFKGDTDWFKVELQAGQRYTFELTGAAGGGGTLPVPELKLYDANGIAQAQVSGNPSYSPFLSFTATKSGTYYVQAGSAYTYNGTVPTGTYTLKEATDAVPFADTTPPHAFSVAGPSYVGNDPETANIRVLFSEPVVAGSGVIVLKLSTGELVETFDVATSTRLSFNATTGELTIDPTAALAYGTGYRLELGATTVKDKVGLPMNADYAGSFVTIERGMNEAGGPGNDSYASTPNSDVIDGGAGTDTVRYKGYSGYYMVRRDGDKLQVLGGGATDTLLNIERIVFDDRAIAYDTAGTAGQAYRLYQASFNRAPDAGGLGFWIAQMDKGLSLQAVAQQFIASAEFKTLFGAAPTDDAFIAALYSNVLHRAPDQSGHDFWADKLGHGLSRADLLTAFSTSDENQAAVIGQISKGMNYIPYG